MPDKINTEDFVDFILANWVLYASDSKKGKRLLYRGLADTKYMLVHNSKSYTFKSIHSAIKKYNEI